MIRMTEERKKRAIDQLKVLHGLPPHDGGSNVCYNDGYFARSIVHEFGMSLDELSKATKFDKLQKKWERARQKFIEETK